MSSRADEIVQDVRVGVGFAGDEKILVLGVESPETVFTLPQMEAFIRHLERIIDEAKELGTRAEVDAKRAAEDRDEPRYMGTFVIEADPKAS